MTTEEAFKKGFCNVCNLYRSGECQNSIWNCLNYRQTPQGMCYLDENQIKDMQAEYDSDRNGNIVNKRKK